MRRTITSVVVTILLALANVNAQKLSATRTNGNSASAAPVKLTLPNKDGSVRFLFIGDTGTGTDKQPEVARMMLRFRLAFASGFVLRMGDNMYGSEKTGHYERKFEDVYRPLLGQKVKFYAALGSHGES